MTHALLTDAFVTVTPDTLLRQLQCNDVCSIKKFKIIFQELEVIMSYEAAKIVISRGVPLTLI